MDPFRRNPNPVIPVGRTFERDYQSAKKAFGAEGEHPHMETAWDMLARGATIGKTVPVPYRHALSAVQAQISTIELLRIHPHGGGNNQNKFAQQICLTLAPPQVIPGGVTPADLTQAIGGSQDNIQLVRTLNGIGGFVPQATAADWRFADPLAIVQWGTGSISNRVEVDFLNGLCLNLTASWITVQAMVNAIGALDTSGLYVLGASVGPGYPKTNNAQRSINVGGVANGASSGVFTIPRYAKSVNLAMTDGVGTLGTGTIQFWSASEGNTASVVFAKGDFLATSNNPTPIPIPNGALYFTILGGYAGNVGGGGFANPNYDAVFNLTI